MYLEHVRCSINSEHYNGQILKTLEQNQEVDTCHVLIRQESMKQWIFFLQLRCTSVELSILVPQDSF